MDQKRSAIKLALACFVICAVISGLVILLDRAVLEEPWRWGILIFITVFVPVVNYVLARRQRPREGE